MSWVPCSLASAFAFAFAFFSPGSTALAAAPDAPAADPVRPSPPAEASPPAPPTPDRGPAGGAAPASGAAPAGGASRADGAAALDGAPDSARADGAAALDGAPDSGTGAPASAPPAASTEAGSARGFAFGADLGFWLHRETGSSSAFFAPELALAYAFVPRYGVRASWGMVGLIDGEGVGSATAGLGNPWVEATARWRDGSTIWLLSLGLTAPAAHVSLDAQGRLERSLLDGAMALSGMWDPWLWTPDRMAVPLTAAVIFPAGTGNRLAIESAVAPSFGTAKGERGATLLAQAAVEFRLGLADSMDGPAVGLRLQEALLPPASVDHLQTSAGLRAYFSIASVPFYAGMLLPLDEPLGFGRGLRAWGIHLGKEMVP